MNEQMKKRMDHGTEAEIYAFEYLKTHGLDESKLLFTKDYDEWTPYYDLCNGDIIIVKKYKIDVKRANLIGKCFISDKSINNLGDEAIYWFFPYSLRNIYHPIKKTTQYAYAYSLVLSKNDVQKFIEDEDDTIVTRECGPSGDEGYYFNLTELLARGIGQSPTDFICYLTTKGYIPR